MLSFVWKYDKNDILILCIIYDLSQDVFDIFFGLMSYGALTLMVKMQLEVFLNIFSFFFKKVFIISIFKRVCLYTLNTLPRVANK